MKNNAESHPSTSANTGGSESFCAPAAYRSVLLLGLSFTTCLVAQAADRRPNLLIIVADDLGWRDVGYHGSEIRTPNIDRLAREGVELNQFYVHPTCSPTRAALLTGRNPDRFGIINALTPTDTRVLPKDSVTLSGVLRDNGYATALIGKWHLGARSENGPRQYGFDYTYGMLHGAVDKYTHRAGNGDLTWHRQDQLLEEEGHADDLITTDAVRYLGGRRGDGRPFLLYLAFSHVHLPLQEDEEWIAPYRDAIKSESRRLFAASVSHMDHSIGRVLTVLQDEGLERNTLVVFFSDNGGIKGPYAWKGGDRGTNWYGGKFFGEYDRLGDNSPWRGSKGEVYEGGVRVPAVLRWPGKLTPRLVNQIICVNDIFPTLATLVGASVPETLDGIDFWPVLDGTESRASRMLAWHTPGQLALRQGDWKLVHTGSLSETGTDELFDLVTDPSERKNLAATEPGRLRELKAELMKVVTATKE